MRKNMYEKIEMFWKMMKNTMKISHQNSHCKPAMTLPEVLLTVAVIGIIASMTISSLVTKVNETKNLTSLKKIYNVLNQVTMFVVLDRSSPNYWGLDEYSHEASELAFSYYKPYFKMLRECSNEDGCWKYPTKFLSGKVYLRRAEFYQYMFTLSDGMNILMNIYPKEIIATEFGVNTTKDSLVFVVDVNGDTRPNQIGRDIFAFVLNGREIVPSGQDNSYNCNRAASGLACTARIISDGWKITYY